VRQDAATKYFFIADLHGRTSISNDILQNCFFAEELVETGATEGRFLARLSGWGIGAVRS